MRGVAREVDSPASRLVKRAAGSGLLVDSGLQNASSAIAAAIEEDIVFRRLEPGHRLTEDELMARFSASRHSVRHALVLLDQIGIVQKTTNKGAAVRTFTREEVENIYEMRELLQEHAAKLIRLPADALTLEALEETHTAFGQAIAKGNVRELFYLNETFHDTLFAACGNPYLCACIKRHAWLAHAIRSYVLGDPDLVYRSHADHRAMIDAYRAEDREALQHLCKHHIRAAKSAYLRASRRGCHTVREA